MPYHVPSRPKAQITESTTSSTPFSRQILRDLFDASVGRRVDATGPDHRLEEEGGDPLGPDPLDLRPGDSLGVVIGDHRHVLDQPPEAGHVRRDAGEAGAEAVGAVVAVDPGDQVVAGVVSLLVPVAPGELRRGVDAVTAAAGQEDARVVDRREAGEPVGQLEGRRVGEIAEGRVLGLLHTTDRLADRVAAVADVGVPEAGRGVEVAVAVRVGLLHVLAAGQHQFVVFDLAHLGERVQNVSLLMRSFPDPIRSPGLRGARRQWSAPPADLG